MRIFISILTIAVMVSLVGYCFAGDLWVRGTIRSYDKQKGELVLEEWPFGQMITVYDNDKKILPDSKLSKLIDRQNMLKKQKKSSNNPYTLGVHYKNVDGKNVVVKYMIIRGGC